ncbi:MAG: murein biosynthesis integral membrane protein MurJ [Anaerolineae bacterium]|nr:murein biosynthesis integral membrane protein MurJ [Anaerolineae bacterium]
MSHFARSTIIVAVFFGIDKILGFGRSLIVGRHFGLSYELDVFNAANNIPDLLSSLISGGALGVALIPVITEYLQKHGRDHAWDLFSRILNLGFLVTAAFAVLVALFAPWLVSNVIAPGFPAEQAALTVELMRLDLFAILIFSISGLVMAGLQANQHFLFPAIAPSLYNVGQILGVVLLAPIYGIHGLVYGVIFGAALHLGIQVPGLIKHGFRWSPKIQLRSKGVRQVLTLLGPRVLTMLFIQIFFIVRDNLASHLAEGSVSALNLGWFIMQVPETLMGTAIAIAILPTLAEIFNRGGLDEFRASVNRAVRTLLSLTIPAAVILAVGIRPIVAYAFGFDIAGTEQIVLAARVYLMGLTGHTLLEISARSFYAQQDARTPLYAAAFNAAMFVALAITLTNRLGFFGIAMANSIAFTTEALLLLYLLNRRFPGVLDVVKPLLRALVSSAAAGLLLYFFLHLGFFPLTSALTQAALAALGMLTVFFLALWVTWDEIKPLLKLGQAVQS